jgi:hypothetical protein
MKIKLHLIRNAVRLKCKWVATGDAKRPLACVWVASKTPESVFIASSTDETGRMHVCA